MRHDKPATRESAIGFELRAAWAARWEVVVVLEPPRGRIRGYVQHVAASSAYALIWDGRGDMHVPLALVAATRRPHFHEDSEADRVAPPAFERLALPMPDQLAFEI